MLPILGFSRLVLSLNTISRMRLVTNDLHPSRCDQRESRVQVERSSELEDVHNPVASFDISMIIAFTIN